MAHNLFSEAARDVYRRGQARFFEVTEQDLLPELVQVHLSAPVTAGLSGPRATADSKAGPLRAASPAEAAAGEEFPPAVLQVEVPVVVEEEDSMVEGVVNGKPLECLTKRWRKE